LAQYAQPAQLLAYPAPSPSLFLWPVDPTRQPAFFNPKSESCWTLDRVSKPDTHGIPCHPRWTEPYKTPKSTPQHPFASMLRNQALGRRVLLSWISARPTLFSTAASPLRSPSAPD
jgi:hypothetical protein